MSNSSGGHDAQAMPPIPPNQPPAAHNRLARPEEIPAALAMILLGDAREQDDSHVVDFLRHTATRGLDLSVTTIALQGNLIAWAILPVLAPGRTMLLMAPPLIARGCESAAAELLEQVCRHFARRDVQLAQALFDPGLLDLRRFFVGRGFQEIADLHYLQTHVPRSSPRPRLHEPMQWQTYSQASHPLFARAILESYRDSLDCPGLNGLRHIEDIIAGHRASGEFDPELWHVVHIGSRPLGVLLLSRIPRSDAVELVYLGLGSESRGKGLGDLLMQQAMHLVARHGQRRLTLAVDSNNEPALRLYYRHGMAHLATKAALLRNLKNISG